MPVKLPVTGRYTAKDQLKADECNKFIGHGSSRSSTNKYREAYGEQANCGHYTESDRVFVSVEGARKNRVPLNESEVMLAVKAGASIVADTVFNRNRPYNVGERALAKLLRDNGYKDTAQEYGTLWSPV